MARVPNPGRRRAGWAVCPGRQREPLAPRRARLLPPPHHALCRRGCRGAQPRPQAGVAHADPSGVGRRGERHDGVPARLPRALPVWTAARRPLPLHRPPWLPRRRGMGRGSKGGGDARRLFWHHRRRGSLSQHKRRARLRLPQRAQVSVRHDGHQLSRQGHRVRRGGRGQLRGFDDVHASRLCDALADPQERDGARRRLHTSRRAAHRTADQRGAPDGWHIRCSHQLGIVRQGAERGRV
mmetsp:Transcript_6783/g.21552  ORF Transcript_6783/g.21552 Transcript_6783/m.21552 type:complete len:239 (+) Transcript_6783:387-1103(+)